MVGHKTVAENSAVYSHMLTGSDHNCRNTVAAVLRPTKSGDDVDETHQSELRITGHPVLSNP